MNIPESARARYRKAVALAIDPATADGERKAAANLCATLRSQFPGIDAWEPPKDTKGTGASDDPPPPPLKSAAKAKAAAQSAARAARTAGSSAAASVAATAAATIAAAASAQSSRVQGAVHAEVDRVVATVVDRGLDTFQAAVDSILGAIGGGNTHTNTTNASRSSTMGRSKTVNRAPRAPSLASVVDGVAFCGTTAEAEEGEGYVVLAVYAPASVIDALLAFKDPAKVASKLGAVLLDVMAEVHTDGDASMELWPYGDEINIPEDYDDEEGEDEDEDGDED